MSVKVLNGARRYYVKADALADHQAGPYRIEVVEGGMYDKRVAELEAELSEAVDILRQWGNMFEGGGIGGTLKILRDANNAFLARHGDQS